MLSDARSGRLDLVAPDLFACEITSIVWKKCQFHGLSSTDAQLILNAFKTVTIGVTSTFDFLDDAFRLAMAHKRSVYDMMYLALSLRKGCDFVTADQKLFNAINAAYPNVLWIANWP